MNIQISNTTALPALIDRARGVLDNARGAAEVLEARDRASVAYDAAKKATRFLKAKGAADELIAAGHRLQAEALVIEARAKCRLADEYDAAQERGEVAKASVRTDIVLKQNDVRPATAADVGISRKDIHEARIIRDAEAEEPGIVQHTIDDAIDAGEEPSKAKISRAVLKASKRKKHTRGPRFSAPQETQHDRDLRALLGVWESSCESARKEFLETVN